MPPASAGQMGRATVAAATWARWGRDALKVGTAGAEHGVAMPGTGVWGWDPPGDVHGEGTNLGTGAWGVGASL